MTSLLCLLGSIMSWEGISTAGGGSEGSGAVLIPLMVCHTVMVPAAAAEVSGPHAQVLVF